MPLEAHPLACSTAQTPLGQGQADRQTNRQKQTFGLGEGQIDTAGRQANVCDAGGQAGRQTAGHITHSARVTPGQTARARHGRNMGEWALLVCKRHLGPA